MGQLYGFAGGLIVGSVVTYGLSIYVSSSKPKTKKRSIGIDEAADATEDDAVTQLNKSLSFNNSSAAAHLNREGLLTDLLREMWSYINVAGSDMIRESVEPSFVDLPGPLSSLHFTKIDLGDVPIRMDNITVHEIEDGKIKLSIDVVWDGTCDMELKADYIGSFGVKSVKLFGRLSLLLKPLKNVIPPFAAIQYGFVTPPSIELDFTGLAQVADFAVIDKKIRATIQDSFSSMVLPNRMLMKMDLGVDFLETYEQPIGVARVTLLRGRGFEEEVKTLGANDMPDVYCNIFMNTSRVWKTAVVKDSLSPVWKDETADFVVSDMDQCLTIHAYDEDLGVFDTDDDLGSAQISFGDLMLAGKTLEVELQKDSVGTGAFVTVHCDMLPLVTSLESLEAAVPETVNPNILYGMATVVVTRAMDLPLEAKEAASFVKVKYGDDFECLSAVVTEYPGVDPLNPAYDLVCFIPLFASQAASEKSVLLELWNGSTKMGNLAITHKSLREAKDHEITELREVPSSGGCKLEFRVVMQGIKGELVADMSSISEALGASLSPSKDGVQRVKVTVKKGWGFKVKKKRFKKDDVPDVYCKVQFGSSPSIWRTSTIKNSVSPSWDENKIYQLKGHSQILNVNVFDQNGGPSKPDDFLGSFRVATGKVLLAGGSMDVELLATGKPTGYYVNVSCELI